MCIRCCNFGLGAKQGPSSLQTTQLAMIDAKHA